MSLVPHDVDNSEVDPIDIATALAESQSWDFDVIADNQIVMAIEGSWQTYSVTLAWSAREEILRLISTFEIKFPAPRLGGLYAAICLANDKCWSGAFVLWPEQKLMVYRYGLNLSGNTQVSSAQISCMVRQAIVACERFYPAFQLVTSGTKPEEAIKVALNEAYGRA